jgi:hypothetical protein
VQKKINKNKNKRGRQNNSDPVDKKDAQPKCSSKEKQPMGLNTKSPRHL